MSENVDSAFLRSVQLSEISNNTFRQTEYM